MRIDAVPIVATAQRLGPPPPTIVPPPNPALSQRLPMRKTRDRSHAQTPYARPTPRRQPMPTAREPQVATIPLPSFDQRRVAPAQEAAEIQPQIAQSPERLNMVVHNMAKEISSPADAVETAQSLVKMQLKNPWLNVRFSFLIDAHDLQALETARALDNVQPKLRAALREAAQIALKNGDPVGDSRILGTSVLAYGKARTPEYEITLPGLQTILNALDHFVGKPKSAKPRRTVLTTYPNTRDGAWHRAAKQLPIIDGMWVRDDIPLTLAVKIVRMKTGYPRPG